LQNIKQDLRVYHDSGLYGKEMTQVAQLADDYIIQKAIQNTHRSHPQKLAIVLDIDETSLSSYEYLVENNFCYHALAFRDHILRHHLSPVLPILRLYHDAIKHDVSVFFVTARSFSTSQATVKNLKEAGYTHWTALYTRTKQDEDKILTN